MENYALWSQVSDFQILSTFLSPNLANTRCPAWYHEVATAWTWRGHPRRHILNAADSSLHRAAGRFGKVAATGIGGFMRLEVNKIQIIIFTGRNATMDWILQVLGNQDFTEINDQNASCVADGLAGSLSALPGPIWLCKSESHGGLKLYQSLWFTVHVVSPS